MANVPLGLALLGSVTSSVGNTLTELFETAFQTIPTAPPGGGASLPQEFTYQQNGLMFGNRLVKRTSEVTINDPNLRTDLANFVNNCTMFDLSDGTTNTAAFATSTDLWTAMKATNAAGYTSITASNGTASPTDCPTAYNAIDTRFSAVLAKTQNIIASQLSPTLAPIQAAAILANQIQQAYITNMLANSSQNVVDILRQKALINVMADANDLAGQRTNDSASVMMGMARADATAQQNASWINGAKIAAQSLPIFRNVIQTYAFIIFPVVSLLTFISHGDGAVKIFKYYALKFVWIELWPMLYAVLNYLGIVYAKYDMAGASTMDLGTYGLSRQTKATIYSHAISGAAVVAYMTISIPFIAWSVVKGLDSLERVMAVVRATSGLSPSPAQVVLDAENARFSPRPTPLSDFSAVPTSFQDVRGAFESSAASSTLNPDLRKQHAANSRGLSVGIRPSGAPAGMVAPRAPTGWSPFAGRSARL